MSSLLVSSHITLNLSRPNSGVVVYAKQYDKDSRVIDIDLINGSEVWDPPAGTEIVVLYVKPDGNKGIYDIVEDYPRYDENAGYEVGARVINSSNVYRCTSEIEAPAGTFDNSKWTNLGPTTPAVQKISEGKVRLTLAEQALTCAGNTFVEISFYSTELRSTTLSFILAVESGVSDDIELMSSEYFNILSELIQGLLGATTHPPQINPINKNWMLWDENTAQYVDSTYSSIGIQGVQGNQGWSIVSVAKTGGTGAGGTVDTYTMRNNNPDTSQQVIGTFNVYNGSDGEGAPGAATPLVDSGTGVVGVAVAYSREDHQHPLNVSDDTPQGITSMASAGEATTYARSDHSHPFGDIIDYIYPVGSIYLSLNEEFNPNIAYGGEWELISNRFLVGAGDLYDLGDTGGEAEHILTSAESGQKAVTIPSSGGHSHTITTKYQKVFAAGTNKDGYWGNGTGSNTSMASIASGTGTHTHSISGSDAASAHNNMPPYLAVYMWQRVE